MDSKRYFPFLDGLRKSAVTNMFGAGLYLQEAFGLDKRQAKVVVLDWMMTFSERKHGEITPIHRRRLVPRLPVI